MDRCVLDSPARPGSAIGRGCYCTAGGIGDEWLRPLRRLELRDAPDGNVLGTVGNIALTDLRTDDGWMRVRAFAVRDGEARVEIEGWVRTEDVWLPIGPRW